jgi:hypothetical protein
MTEFLENMPQKSRAYYTKAGTGYKRKDVIKRQDQPKRSGTVGEFQAKKRRGVNRARTTTRRMEEPCDNQRIGAGGQNLDTPERDASSRPARNPLYTPGIRIL